MERGLTASLPDPPLAPRDRMWKASSPIAFALGLTAPAGWHTPFPAGPPTFEECPPAAHDAAARLRYLDEALASVLA